MITAQDNKTVEANVAEGVEKAKHTVAEGLETAKSKVAEGYEKVAEKAHEVWEKAADTSIHDAQTSVARFVRHNPGKSLLVAAAAGIVVGVLLRGRAH